MALVIYSSNKVDVTNNITRENINIGSSKDVNVTYNTQTSPDGAINSTLHRELLLTNKHLNGIKAIY